MPNCLDFVVALIGAAKLGAVVVPINGRFKATEIDHVVTHGDIRVLLTAKSPDGTDYPALISETFPEIADQDPQHLELHAAPALRQLVDMRGRDARLPLAAAVRGGRRAGVPRGGQATSAARGDPQHRDADVHVRHHCPAEGLPAQPRGARPARLQHRAQLLLPHARGPLLGRRSRSSTSAASRRCTAASPRAAPTFTPASSSRRSRCANSRRSGSPSPTRSS